VKLTQLGGHFASMAKASLQATTLWSARLSGTSWLDVSCVRVLRAG